MDFVEVDPDKGNEVAHSCLEETTNIFDGVEVQEPYVGMEFDSEETARKFYVAYARRAVTNYGLTVARILLWQCGHGCDNIYRACFAFVLCQNFVGLPSLDSSQ
ncbi:hypothetical protein TSUD_164750 [Trifolium subterraneum]|uniref:Protein FAR1-RELATED SEQUENCE n=1 Tax=Trifolium subterraneum TaxID=3900 RepID=A0A2Z6MAG5_TRISU|nr:hypothetical protein TSUD_164750 [Trifolium subterraneum]